MKHPDFSYELQLLDQGFSVIAGFDEVGRGCWAGPVVVGAVIFPAKFYKEPEEIMLKIRDSKTLSERQRLGIETYIKTTAIWAIGECSNSEIDKIGIGPATRLAAQRALDNLSLKPDYLLFDGRESTQSLIPQQAIIDGDALSTSIAAASILAKNYRDKFMHDYEAKYPGYGFDKHVGYGTKAHQEALKIYGPGKIHRYSYKPVKAS